MIVSVEERRRHAELIRDLLVAINQDYKRRYGTPPPSTSKIGNKSSLARYDTHSSRSSYPHLSSSTYPSSKRPAQARSSSSYSPSPPPPASPSIRSSMSPSPDWSPRPSPSPSLESRSPSLSIRSTLSPSPGLDSRSASPVLTPRIPTRDIDMLASWYLAFTCVRFLSSVPNYLICFRSIFLSFLEGPLCYRTDLYDGDSTGEATHYSTVLYYSCLG